MTKTVKPFCNYKKIKSKNAANSYILSGKLPHITPSTATITTIIITQGLHKVTFQHTKHHILKELPLLGHTLGTHAKLIIHKVYFASFSSSGSGVRCGVFAFARALRAAACVKKGREVYIKNIMTKENVEEITDLW